MMDNYVRYWKRLSMCVLLIVCIHVICAIIIAVARAIHALVTDWEIMSILN